MSPPLGADIRQIRVPTLAAVQERLANLEAVFGPRSVWAEIVFEGPGYVLTYSIVPPAFRSSPIRFWAGGGA